MKRIQMKLACLLLLMMVTVDNTESREPVLHRVGGGRYSWKPNVNFTDWAIHEQFIVGDWLCKFFLTQSTTFHQFSLFEVKIPFVRSVDFGFNKQLYSVLQVNETSYANCIEENFINNITKGGRDVFNLTMPKPYYFISGRGYCFKGMKVATIVQNYQPFPTTNGSLLNVSSASKFQAKWILLVLILHVYTTLRALLFFSIISCLNLSCTIATGNERVWIKE